MTNFEKIKELKEYEVAQILSMLPMHVAGIQEATGADRNLDAVDLEEDSIEIITSWLKDEYDEKKGFRMYLSGGSEYFTKENLSHYDYLENTHNSYNKYFESDDEDEE